MNVGLIKMYNVTGYVVELKLNPEHNSLCSNMIVKKYICVDEIRRRIRRHHSPYMAVCCMGHYSFLLLSAA